MDLVAVEFTKFLAESQSVKRKYSYNIAYNETKDFWIIVMFPTSIRFDFSITRNNLHSSTDTTMVASIFSIGIILYVIMLFVNTYIYARITAGTLRDRYQN